MRGVTFKNHNLGYLKWKCDKNQHLSQYRNNISRGEKTHKNILTLNENGSKVFLEAKEENEITFLYNSV